MTTELKAAARKCADEFLADFETRSVNERHVSLMTVFENGACWQRTHTPDVGLAGDSFDLARIIAALWEESGETTGFAPPDFAMDYAKGEIFYEPGSFTEELERRILSALSQQGAGVEAPNILDPFLARGPMQYDPVYHRTQKYLGLGVVQSISDTGVVTCFWWGISAQAGVMPENLIHATQALTPTTKQPSELSHQWDGAESCGAVETSTEQPPLAGDTLCQCCGCDNPAWFADNELWNLVMGGPDATDDPGGVVCLNCFARKAGEVLRLSKPTAEQQPGVWELVEAVEPSDAERSQWPEATEAYVAALENALNRMENRHAEG